MNFEVSPYELRFKAPGWSPRSGALVRWRDANGTHRYSDLHPWEEWGDPTLFAVINDLKQADPNRMSSLRVVRRMLACAEFWPTKPVPVHYLHWDGSVSASLARAWELGIDLLKVKIWHHTHPDDIRNLAKTNSRVRFRLDGPRASSVAADVAAQLDFIEDGTSGRSAWDSRSERAASDVAVICKPFRDDPVERMRPGLRTVVTSSLNHPLGVAQAAGVAATFAPAEQHGVASHFVYEADEFHDLILLKDGQVSFAPYADFVRLLERREWISP